MKGKVTIMKSMEYMDYIMETMKKLIIIPAYNEAENLPKVISAIKNLLPEFDYVIINDVIICIKNSY